MNAVVLAGGYGTRLMPLTENTIKPMLTVCNRPIIDYCLSQLYHFGIKDVVFTLGHKPQQITEWAIGYKGIKTRFCVENSPLGTLGSVKSAAEYLSDTFIVLSGDGISNIDLNALLNRHIAAKTAVTAVVMKHSNPSLYGVCSLNNGLIEGFIEKPHTITSPSYINCGIYAVNKSVLDIIDKENCDFARDLFPILALNKQLGYYEHKGYWQDIGDVRSYYETNFDILKRMAQNEGGYEGGFYPFIKNFSSLKSKLLGTVSPSLINSELKADGFINESIVGNAEIKRGASIDRCVVLDGASVEGRKYGCVIGDNFCVDIFDLPYIGANEGIFNPLQ